MIGIPVKDSMKKLPCLLDEIGKLTHPKKCITLCFIEGDSQDSTYGYLTSKKNDLEKEYRKVILLKKDFAFKAKKEERHGLAYFTYWTYGLSLTEITRHITDEKYLLLLTDNVKSFSPHMIEKFIEDDKEVVGLVIKNEQNERSDFIVISSKRFTNLSQIEGSAKTGYAIGIPGINYRTEKDFPAPFNALDFSGLDPEFFQEIRQNRLIEVDYVPPVNFVKTEIFKKHPEITYEPLILEFKDFGYWVCQVPLAFCLKAKLAGYKLYIDLSLECVEY